jgi:hypothetical protein
MSARLADLLAEQYHPIAAAAVRAWGRGDECAELVEIARAAYVAWCGVPATAPVAEPQPTPLGRTKAERSKRARQMSLDLDDDGDDE